jgi:hypothetical protein
MIKPFKGKEENMRNFAMLLIGLSALGFLIAVITCFVGPIIGVSPEGFSRGCTNLALISIALGVWLRQGGKES